MIWMNKGVVYTYSWNTLYSYHYYSGSAESTRLVCLWYIIILFYTHVLHLVVCGSTSIYHLWLYRALTICEQAFFDITSQGWQVTTLTNLPNWKYMPHMLCSTAISVLHYLRLPCVRLCFLLLSLPYVRCLALYSWHYVILLTFKDDNTTGSFWLCHLF